MKTLYIIETMYHPTEFSEQWCSDSIGENEPRPIEECEADVLAFQNGDCGPEMSIGFAENLEGTAWRIVAADDENVTEGERSNITC